MTPTSNIGAATSNVVTQQQAALPAVPVRRANLYPVIVNAWCRRNPRAENGRSLALSPRSLKCRSTESMTAYMKRIRAAYWELKA